MPFPAPTTGRYLPGVGYALTRANLALMLKRKVIDPSDSPEQVARKFAPVSTHNGERCLPDNRHVARARMLMAHTATPKPHEAA